MNREKEVSITDVYLKFKDFLIRRWIILLVAVLIGAATGFLSTSLKDDKYQSGVVVSSAILNKEDLYGVLLPLVNNQNEEPSSRLRRFFNNNEVFTSVDEYSVDTASISNSIIFRFTLSDSSAIKKISKVIEEFYLSQNSLNSKFKKEVKLNKEYLDVLNKEIKELNLYQEKLLNNLDNNNSYTVSLSGMHEELIRLYEKQIELRKITNVNHAVRVTKESQIIPVQKHPLRKAFLWAVIFLVIISIILFFIELDRASKKF